MSYGTNYADMCRQVGLYAAGLLKGAKPMDPPARQGHQVRAVINLNTARALQPRCTASWIRLDKVVGRDFPVVRGINRQRGDISPGPMHAAVSQG